MFHGTLGVHQLCFQKKYLGKKNLGEVSDFEYFSSPPVCSPVCYVLWRREEVISTRFTLEEPNYWAEELHIKTRRDVKDNLV